MASDVGWRWVLIAGERGVPLSRSRIAGAGFIIGTFLIAVLGAGVGERFETIFNVEGVPVLGAGTVVGFGSLATEGGTGGLFFIVEDFNVFSFPGAGFDED